MNQKAWADVSDFFSKSVYEEVTILGERYAIGEEDYSVYLVETKDGTRFSTREVYFNKK